MLRTPKQENHTLVTSLALHSNLLPEKAMTKLEVYFVFNLYSL